jgi:quinol monooxygenase YgiN
MQVEELAKEVASGVEATEPGVLKYQWFKTATPQGPKIVVWEV